MSARLPHKAPRHNTVRHMKRPHQALRVCYQQLCLGQQLADMAATRLLEVLCFLYPVLAARGVIPTPKHTQNIKHSSSVRCALRYLQNILHGHPKNGNYGYSYVHRACSVGIKGLEPDLFHVEVDSVQDGALVDNQHGELLEDG